MFEPAADAGHKAMRGLLTLTGQVLPIRSTAQEPAGGSGSSGATGSTGSNAGS